MIAKLKENESKVYFTFSQNCRTSLLLNGYTIVNESLTSLVVFCFFCLISVNSWSQTSTVVFKSGKQTIESNLENIEEIEESFFDTPIEGYYYRYLLFDKVPNKIEHERYESMGVELLEYFPNNVFSVRFHKDLDLSTLQRIGATSLFRIDVNNKIDARLKELPLPEWAMSDDKLRIIVKFYPKVSEKEILRTASIFSLSETEENIRGQLLFADIDVEQLYEIAGLSSVSYIEIGSPPDFPEDTGGRTLQRANLLNSPLPGGLKYNAEGVNIMVRDDGAIGPQGGFAKYCS